MSVKDIIFLGCSAQQPTRRRNHGGFLLRWNEEGFLFDPGEGMQRQFIFAKVAPTVINRIFVSHFHGDHCLGLGSMLMRLNLDKVQHPIHCYYPASGKKYFDRLRFGCIYHENIQVIEHPVSHKGIVHDDGKFIIEADFLDHGTPSVGWRVTEKDRIKFDKEKLKKLHVIGPLVKQLEKEKKIKIKGRDIKLEDVSWVRKGDSLAVIFDTRLCKEAVQLAKNAKVLICESTYLEDKKDLAKHYMHMTAKDAATLAKQANVKMLLITHFSARYPDEALFENEAREIFSNVHAAQDLKRFSFPD